MRRFNLAAVVVVLGLAGLFTFASAGKPAEKAEPPNAIIHDLLEQRLMVYSEIFENARKGLGAGHGDFLQLQAAHASLLRAELDLCETNAQRIAVLEKLVKVAELTAAATDKLMKAGSGSHTEMLTAKARLLEVRIELENERAASQST